MFRRIKAWFQPEPPRPPPAAAEDFHRRLHLAKLQLPRVTSPGPRTISDTDKAAARAPDETFPFKTYAISQEGAMAAALENILHGERVSSEAFIQLYHQGFVFKEKERKWAITEAGKSLIERRKLLDRVECRVNGVQCPKSWS